MDIGLKKRNHFWVDGYWIEKKEVISGLKVLGKKLLNYEILYIINFVLFYSCGDSNNNSGCTDFYAYNFDEYATYDDGSCLYIICDDPVAINYGELSENL